MMIFQLYVLFERKSQLRKRVCVRARVCVYTVQCQVLFNSGNGKYPNSLRIYKHWANARVLFYDAYRGD